MLPVVHDGKTIYTASGSPKILVSVSLDIRGFFFSISTSLIIWSDFPSLSSFGVIHSLSIEISFGSKVLLHTKEKNNDKQTKEPNTRNRFKQRSALSGAADPRLTDHWVGPQVDDHGPVVTPDPPKPVSFYPGHY